MMQVKIKFRFFIEMRSATHSIEIDERLCAERAREFSNVHNYWLTYKFTIHQNRYVSIPSLFSFYNFSYASSVVSINFS